MNTDLQNKIQSFIQSKPVIIYMKGSPEFPQCGFSYKACQILLESGVERKSLDFCDVLSDSEMRVAMKDFSQWPTFPQIYIHGKFVGGVDILTELYESGELQGLLEKN